MLVVGHHEAVVDDVGVVDGHVVQRVQVHVWWAPVHRHWHGRRLHLVVGKISNKKNQNIIEIAKRALRDGCSIRYTRFIDDY